MYTNLLRRLAAILAVVVGVSVLTALPARAVTELTVMSWNIKSQQVTGYGWAEEIVQNDVQIAGLQEACEGDVPRLESSLEAESGVGWTAYFSYADLNVACLVKFENRAEFGNVIFVRDNVGASNHTDGAYTDCAEAAEHERRTWQAVTVAVGGVNVRVFNTHMDYADKAPACQIKQLAGLAQASGSSIVMGDFNRAAAETAELWPFTQNGYVSAHPASSDYFTFKNEQGSPSDPAPKSKIDYIFYKGIRLVERGIPTWTPLSDHRSLTATFDANASDRADVRDAKLHWSPNAEGYNEFGQVETMQQVLADVKQHISTVPISGVTRDFTPAPSCGGSHIPAGATTLCFSSGDNTAEEWIPQGITTNNDATGGAASPILVSWYDSCDAGVQGVDWGREHQGCQTNPAGTHREKRKGVQVSLYFPGGTYKNVLLVEPFNNSSNNPSFHATHMHAGGLALYGRYLFVADTSWGFRVFDTQQILDMQTTHGPYPWINDAANYLQVGRHDNRYYSHGYRYLMPAVGEYRLDAAPSPGGDSYCHGTGTPLKFSYASIDRSATPHRLVAGEYCSNSMISRDFHNGRVARWRLTNTSNPANLLTDGGTAQDAYYLPATHVQGLEARGDTFYLNTSNSQEHGVLHKTQRVGTNLTFLDWKKAAVGTEDLSYDTSQAPHRIFSLSEYYGRRAIYSIPSF